jgi:hypothetical protein
MADDADRSGDRMEIEERLRDRARPVDPYQPPAGKAGDCDLCGGWCGRLIGGACPPCRDKHGLP